VSKHALLSPSAAHRWIACPPSARLCENVTDEGSSYAQQGTDAHTLAEYKLRKASGEKRLKDPRKHLTNYDQQMEDTTDEYVNFCMEEFERLNSAGGAMLIVEQRVKYHEYVPDSSGLADCLIVGDGELVVIDFKYGENPRNLVHAEDNPQLKLYALGGLLAYDGIYDIANVKMCVVQPRLEYLGTSTIPKEELYQWAEEIVKPAAELAWAGEGEQLAGEHCKFCKVKVKCRALKDLHMECAKHDFKEPPLLDNSEIAEILVLLDKITSWLSDVKEYAFQSALNGEVYPGFKLVERQANREYTDEEAVAERLRGAGHYNIFKPPKLVGLTEMAKVIGKKAFGELLEGDDPLVHRPSAKPTLVPESDKRKAIQIKTAAEDFADHETGGNENG
jgi:hypothetical protein